MRPYSWFVASEAVPWQPLQLWSAKEEQAVEVSLDGGTVGDGKQLSSLTPPHTLRAKGF